MGKIALIVGGSGLVGRKLLHLLLEGQRYDSVVAFVRAPLHVEHPKLTELIIDFDQLEQYEQHFCADDVFCCLGTTIKKAKTQEAMYKIDVEYPLTIAQLALGQGAQHFLFISAIGANADSRIFYSRIKGIAERELREMPYDSLSILRPSLLLGEREEYRLAERWGGVIFQALSFLLIGPLRKYRAIEAETVARAMYRMAMNSSKKTAIYSSEQIEQLGR
ncbi:oxidoreductase [Paenibacillus lentus]|uniref:Oxidoreductase n=1 Tax=Paenibacillus lentus TaxID=1338368 RepID=A0A3S8RQL9_9BACL|nr:oxidoreductase [Paenibacillus lentus]AZK45256.1 oxidoreductase [Paenibacillus lentus]